MSRVRVLVGTRKGAFVLTSDGKRDDWAVSGPEFPGWEVYHLKGDASKARRKLGWDPLVSFEQLVQMMVDEDLNRLRRSVAVPPPTHITV